MVNNSDKQPILHLTDLVKGQYTFELTVTDNKGLSGTDEVSVFVKESKWNYKSLKSRHFPLHLRYRLKWTSMWNENLFAIERSGKMQNSTMMEDKE